MALTITISLTPNGSHASSVQTWLTSIDNHNQFDTQWLSCFLCTKIVLLFNVESAGLQTFLALLRHLGTTCGWDFEVPQDLADPLSNLLDMTTNHGRFTPVHLRNSRRLHICKLLAFKNCYQAFSQPRVKFKKALCVFPLLCLSSLVVSAASPIFTHCGIQVKANFDTDALNVGMDNKCSACVSNAREHFVGIHLPINKVIKGYGGARVHNVWQGTMKLSMEDDNSSVETFLIPNSCHDPHGDSRLLSPQHWAKHMK